MVEANTKILILEKDPVDTALLQKELDQSFGKYTARIVQTKKEFEEALRDFEPDIILSDYSIPDFNWDDAFLLKQKLAPGTPFILLSDNAAKEDIIDQIRRGVTDCIFKDNPGSLAPKVKRALEYAKKMCKMSEKLRFSKKMQQRSAPCLTIQMWAFCS